MIKMQKSVGFLLGIVLAVFLFLVSQGCKERRAIGRFMNLLLDGLETRRPQGRQEAFIPAEGDGKPSRQSPDPAFFLKTYQPEIIATLINVLEMAHIPLEDYFAALEVKEDWHKFQNLMGEVSLMVLEKSRIPEGKDKESAVSEVRERYIPKLIAAVEAFKATFD